MPEKKQKEVTSIRVDPDLWKEVKIQAIREDIEVSELMERAIKHEFERLKTK
jgi:post-segregation antitoxin (ccd killing protein)